MSTSLARIEETDRENESAAQRAVDLASSLVEQARELETRLNDELAERQRGRNSNGS